ncbi:MAG: ABC transporter substrate-binding protein [Prevotella sp.]|nr:ABC transporter substrate-binding protein [Prevotella sp.]
MKKHFIYDKVRTAALWLLGILALLPWGGVGVGLASCSDDDAAPAPLQQEVVTVNVDVILPLTMQASWRYAIEDALGNIDRAQQSCSKRVKLNLRYHDEDDEDLEALAYALAHPGRGDDAYVQPDTCHAIIGPYYSAHARTILNQARRSRLPVVMPTCTSADLQRSEARQTNSFFLTESDITQCVVLLTAVQTVGHRRVGLLYSDDTYGQSFRDWFGFVATQMGLDVVPGGIRAYEAGDGLDDFFELMSEGEGDVVDALLVALGRAEDYPPVMEAREAFFRRKREQGTVAYVPTVYVPDVAYSPQILSYSAYGTYPAGSTGNGFVQSYQAVHGSDAPYGAAQVYDALTVIALARAAQLYAPDPDSLSIDGQRVQFEIAPYGPVLSDWMRAVVAADDPAPITLWNGYGLASAFSLIEGGMLPSLRGATGEMEFDQLTRTTMLHTNYQLWDSDGTGGITHFATVSTGGSGMGLVTDALWNWQTIIHSLDPEAGADVNHQLPDLREQWAVVISTSTTWENYRHQADALAMYQLLKRHGYDDDHIVLIVEDNLANDPRNPFPGEVYLERSTIQSSPDALVNADVRQGVVVDYHFSDLYGPADLADILLGWQSEHLPHVVHSTNADDVFLFWSGHGADSGGPLWGNEDSRTPVGAQRIRNIVERMPHRRMMLALESCYSGLWGEAITGVPDVIVLTAANAYETSKPDVYDSDMGTYLSNAFSRSFLRTVGGNPSVSIADLYYQLARTTSGSHVTLYNIEQYGTANKSSMSDYFKGK